MKKVRKPPVWVESFGDEHKAATKKQYRHSPAGLPENRMKAG